MAKIVEKNGSEELGDAWRKRMRLVGCSESYEAGK